MHLVPQPRKITVQQRYFTVLQSSRIVLGTSCAIADLIAARLIREEIETASGLPCLPQRGRAVSAVVFFSSIMAVMMSPIH